MAMRLGINVSEWDEKINWHDVLFAGVSFLIARLGWGFGRMDNKALSHICDAADLGMDLGLYFNSVASSEEEARCEARIVRALWERLLLDAGHPDLQLGFYVNREDSHFYSERKGIQSKEEETKIVAAFLEEMNRLSGMNIGVYGSSHWLENKIDRDFLPKGTPIWCAKWGDQVPENATIWQFHSAMRVGPVGNEKFYEANFLLV